MLGPELEQIITRNQSHGWILEPDAKRLLSGVGVPVPQGFWMKAKKDVARAVHAVGGYPVAAKVVSPRALHKTELHGVALGVGSDSALSACFDRFSEIEGFQGLLVEEMISGRELIVGGKNDTQFGALVLIGIGGTGVEIYGDTTLRMAPLTDTDVRSMIRCLKGRALVEGYRGEAPVHLDSLIQIVLAVSELTIRLGDRIESIDLNPVICSPERCTAADARIILAV